MKRIIFSLFILISCFKLFGQTESFDVFKFSAPDGWKRSQDRAYIKLENINMVTGKFAQIAIYASRAGGSDPVQEFTADWQDLMKFTQQAAPDKKEIEKDPVGWTVVSAETEVKSPDKKFIATLVSIIGYGRVGDIIINVDDEESLPFIQNFLNSVEMMTAAEVAQLYPSGNTNTVSQGTGGAVTAVVNSQKATEISGFYRSLCNDRSDVTSITNASGTGYSYISTSTGGLRVRHVVIFPDGTFCHWPLDHGLLDYKTTRSQNPNYWGVYQYQNGSGTVKLDGMSTTLTFTHQNGELNYDHCTFKKLPFVDNLKLNGTYSLESNEASYKSYGMNAEPTIKFSPDGRFSDTGAIYYLNHVKNSSTDLSDNKYGDGNYQIVNFVIILTFDDGRRYEYTYLNIEGSNPSPHQMGLGLNWATRK